VQGSAFGDGDSAAEVRCRLVIIGRRYLDLRKKDMVEAGKTHDLDGTVTHVQEHFVSEAFGHVRCQVGNSRRRNDKDPLVVSEDAELSVGMVVVFEDVDGQR
jgi:hypothetical protein